MKTEKIDELYFNDVNRPVQLDRRHFLKRLGGGIIIVLALSELSFIRRTSKEEEEPDSDSKRLDFNVYLRIGEDGKVDCFTGKIEMGQGIITSLAQVLAEELEVDLSQVKMVMGDTDLCPYDAGTWGSLTTRFFDPLLRVAAAEAKAELLKLGANVLKLPVNELKAQQGSIFAINRPEVKMTYAALTKGQKIVKTITKVPPLKDVKAYKLTGKSIRSTDAFDKVTGRALYAADIQLDQMMYASIKRPPALGSTCLLYTSPSPRDRQKSRMPSSA
jgi:isoquinoline 1-oxidoreductase